MALCPTGHQSVSTDFCDVCGLQMSGVPDPVAVPAAAPTATVASPAAGSEHGPDVCPVCGEPRTGRFCEGCSYDFVSGVGLGPATPTPEAPTPVAPTAAPDAGPARSPWSVVVTADRAYYEVVLAQGEPEGETIPFPESFSERSIPLVGERVRIGRRSRSRGEAPEIDLAGPPEDPGVSHRHAVLLAQPDGGWAVQDVGSTNGTTINDNDDPIAPEVPVPLVDSDRVHVGAWTTITVHLDPDANSAPNSDEGS